MGFLDKAKEQAKQLADQAQKKIDEAQDKFNERQQQGAGAPPEGQATKYDQQGRPIEEPAASEDTGLGGPHGEPGPPAEGDSNTSPDPFKPIQP